MSLENRYDFVMLFDVENGNPNGDPDAGNAPRVDVETGYGFITDVCIKRKIRNYVELVKDGEAGYNILIKPDKSLNSKFTAAYEAEGLETKQKGKKADDVKKARDYMCKNYFDVRTFGAVMSTGDDPCGIVRGPVQINFARSISPVNIQDVTITRQARTTEDRTATGDTEMGRKSVIPYALYRAEGYVSESDNDITVVLDTNLTPELIEEGFVREIISKIQTMRKEAGFEVTDKIGVSLENNQVIENIFRSHEDQIKSEVLAEDVVYGKVSGYEKDWKINSENVKLGVWKLS